MNPTDALRQLQPCAQSLQAAHLQPVPAGLAALLRRCCGRTLRLHLPAPAAAELSCRFADSPPLQAELLLRVTLGGAPLDLYAAGPGIASLRPLLDDGVPADWRLAGVRVAVAPWWPALQTLLGSPVELRAVSPAPGAAPGPGLAATLHSGAQPLLAVHLQAAAAEDWAALAGACRHLPLQAPAPALAVLHAAVVERVPLPLRELRQLAWGDLLLLDAPANTVNGPGHPATAWLAAGRHLLPGLRAGPLADGRWRVQRQPAEASSTRPRSDPMPPHAEDLNTPLDDLPVDLQVEIAEVALPLAQLRALAPGQVLETRATLPAPPVVLRFGGQRIGHGELVAVGDRLAVRVLALRPVAEPLEAAST